MKRLAILISGRGSNMVALADAVRSGRLPATIVGVGSDKADAPGLATARERGIATAAFPRGDRGRDAQEAALNAWLEGVGAEIVALAGFMRVLSPSFCERWRDRLVNIHPSLLPLYPGLDTHGRALADGAKRHGCTVHWVTAGVDEGPIIARASLDVASDDTAATLAARVLELEHRLYPAALLDVLRGHAKPPGLTPPSP